jgi:hypothetical protein
MADQSKDCPFCEDKFVPNRRIGSRQKVCSKLSCQLKRKRINQSEWLTQNPDYFKDRYFNTKSWLEEHPGYLQAYRQRRRSESRHDIQDESTLIKSMSISELHDIQDELRDCFTKHLTRIDVLCRRDIQDELKQLITLCYIAMIYKSKWRFK